MSIVRSICAWLAKRRPLRRIERENGEPYLDRYYLFGHAPMNFSVEVKTIFSWLPFCVFLHHFRDSDRDEELHNHPWGTSASLMLAGGYREERRGEQLPFLDRATYAIVARIVRPLRINVIRANDFHRVELLEDDAWTIFVTGRRAQSWGFWNPHTDEFVPWREFIARREAGINSSGGRA